MFFVDCFLGPMLGLIWAMLRSMLGPCWAIWMPYGAPCWFLNDVKSNPTEQVSVEFDFGGYVGLNLG